MERPKLLAERAISEVAKDSANKSAEQPPKSNLEESKPAMQKLDGETLDKNEKLEHLVKVPEQPAVEQCNPVEHKSESKEEKQKETIKPPPNKDIVEDKVLGDEAEDDEDGNPIEKINKNLEEMDSDEMEKMMEEEEFANKQLQLVALQLEKEKKRRAEEAKRLESETKTVASVVPAKRGRKPKQKEPPQMQKSVVHEPIVSNVKALIRNDNDNDELSEPPGVALPLFEELASRKTDEETTPKRSRGRGNNKYSLLNSC